jgi:hypothetical protein
MRRFCSACHPSGEAAGIFSEWDLYCQCGACDLSRTPRRPCTAPLSHLDGSACGKLGSPCYVRVYEGWVHPRGFSAQGNGFGVPYFVIPFS